jgi:hypothetical protein
MPQRLANTLDTPSEFPGHLIDFPASIGICCGEYSGNNRKSLQRNYLHGYSIKKVGRGYYLFHGGISPPWLAAVPVCGSRLLPAIATESAGQLRQIFRAHFALNQANLALKCRTLYYTIRSGHERRSNTRGISQADVDTTSTWRCACR